MARILRGVKGSLGLRTWGGGVFGRFIPCNPLQSPAIGFPWACGVPVAVGHFWPWCMGIFRRVQFWPLLGSVLACTAFSFVGCGFGWVGGFWGLVGLFCVVILSACVPCPPAKGKKPFLPLVCLVCPCLRFPLSASLYIQEKRPFLWVALSLVVVFGFSFSEHEHGKRCGAFAEYPYFVRGVVCFHLAGGWACDIIEVRAVCCLGSAFAMVNGGGFHGVAC